MSEETVVLITGASSGIGRATAGLLGRSGFRVFGASRNPDNNESECFEALELDVRSDDSVQSCYEALMEKTGRLDVLINNAGAGYKGAAEEVSVAEVKALFETNFFGVVRMTKGALPIMRKQKRGRIINVSSVAGWMCSPFSGPYCASKHALEGYTEALRYEVAQFGIQVSLLEPGFVKTNFTSAAGAAEVQLDFYSRQKQATVDFAGESLKKAPGPEKAARKILKIIRSGLPRLRYTTGVDAALAALIRKWFPAGLLEWGIRKKFGV